MCDWNPLVDAHLVVLAFATPVAIPVLTQLNCPLSVPRLVIALVAPVVQEPPQTVHSVKDQGPCLILPNSILGLDEYSLY